MNQLPSLNLAITRLVNTGTDNFAIWVVQAPYLSGYVLRDCIFPSELTQTWQEWQLLFASHSRLDIGKNATPVPPIDLGLATNSNTSRLMQSFGMNLWRWVFDGVILSSLDHSLGIAMGQNKRLRFRLEIRDPNLVALPWEIMQREPGQSAISLSPDILLFSRSHSEVKPLANLSIDQTLNILLVLGYDKNLNLEQEAAILKQTLVEGVLVGGYSTEYVSCSVKILLQPTPQKLIQELETKVYNLFFYAGHGLPGEDGGLLFLQDGTTLNGIELAQVLTNTGIKLAVFNACWGAQPAAVNGQAIPASSLAEVLIRQGVPAVLGMRDGITDEESHTFIKAFAVALRSRKPVDEAVAEARQKLLALYRFNQPAWTLPVLYLHPNFDGELIKKSDETIIPETKTSEKKLRAYLRQLSAASTTRVLAFGVTRIGREKDNHVVLSEPWASRRHAEILCRTVLAGEITEQMYYLQDNSGYGTWILNADRWEQILHREIHLTSGTKLRFGNANGETWEFIIEE